MWGERLTALLERARTIKRVIAETPRFTILRILLHVMALVGLVCTLLISVVAEDFFTRGIENRPDWPPIPHTSSNPMGINTFLNEEADPAVVERSLDMIAAGGFGYVRQLFGWYEIEPQPGEYIDANGVSTWEKYDRIVALANERGIQVIARLDKPPLWSKVNQPNPQLDGPPDRLGDYASFVEAVVERYGDRIRYVQIWNEPNLAGEWGGQPIDPRGYVDLLATGYRAAKRANPDVTVLMAGLAPTDQTGPDNLSDLLFLQRVYDFGGADFFDIAAVMVYGYGYSPSDRRVAFERNNFSRPIQTREIMVRNGDADTPIWAVEYGWVSLPDDWTGDPSPWGDPVSAETKADYLVSGYVRAQREWPWMGMMAVWTFRFPQPPDADGQAANPTRGFGIVEHDFTPRPAYTALQRAALHIQRASTGAYWLTETEQIALDAGDQVRLHVAGDEIDLVYEGDGTLDVSLNDAAQHRVTIIASDGTLLSRATIADTLTNDPYDITLQLPDSGESEVAIVGYIVAPAAVHTWVYPLVRVLVIIAFLLNTMSTVWLMRELATASPAHDSSEDDDGDVPDETRAQTESPVTLGDAGNSGSLPDPCDNV